MCLGSPETDWHLEKPNIRADWSCPWWQSEELRLWKVWFSQHFQNLVKQKYEYFQVNQSGHHCRWPAWVVLKHLYSRDTSAWQNNSKRECKARSRSYGSSCGGAWARRGLPPSENSAAGSSSEFSNNPQIFSWKKELVSVSIRLRTCTRVAAIKQSG